MYIFASRETSIDSEIRNTLLALESPEGVPREPDNYLVADNCRFRDVRGNFVRGGESRLLNVEVIC